MDFTKGKRAANLNEKAMIVENIRIENFKGLRDEFVEFDKSVTVLAGRNGGGKSTILEAVAIMLSWLPVRLCNYTLSGKQIPTSSVTFGAAYSRLTMYLKNSTEMKLTLLRELQCPHSRKNSAEMCQADKYGRGMKVLLESDEKVELPVLAYYGASRDISGHIAPKPISTTDRTEVYKNAFRAGTDFSKMCEWYVQMYDRRRAELDALAGMPLKKANLMRIQIDEFYNPLRHVTRALAGFEADFGSFEVRDGKMFLGSRNIPAENLSDGEKTVVSLLSDIAMRMIVANPKLDDPLKSDAVILIDELDLHLHPEWQSSITQKLPEIFPRTQFIISSHSPSVMSVAKNLYRADEQNQRFERVENAYGRSPSDILSQLLNAHREPHIAKKIRQMYDAIDRGAYRTAQSIIDELNVIIPEDPEVLRGEYLVRALR